MIRMASLKYWMYLIAVLAIAVFISSACSNTQSMQSENSSTNASEKNTVENHATEDSSTSMTETVPGVGTNTFVGEDFDNTSIPTTVTEITSPEESISTAVTNPDPTIETIESAPTIPDVTTEIPGDNPTTPDLPTDAPDNTTTFPEETTNSTTETEETTAPEGDQVTAYEWYESLSPEKQVEFFETFASMADFVHWYNNAKAEYDTLNPPIEVEDGTIDLGKVTGG